MAKKKTSDEAEEIVVKAKNENLIKARMKKNDKFYTKLTDIEKELLHYVNYFNEATIFMNCDDPTESNFWQYFMINFKAFNIKKIISTHYEDFIPSYKLEFTGDGIIKSDIKGNGDFRNAECIELLNQSDIVVTNPPFSLIREYISQLIKYNKKFLIIGDLNTIAYKEIFEYIKEGRMWLGIDNGGTKWFKVPDHYEIKTESRIKFENGDKYFSKGSITWFTNLEHNKRHEELILCETYSPEKFPKYDNFDAIEVSRVAKIPKNYSGVMGVPITFLDKYNPDQFKILGRLGSASVNGKNLYVRVLIQNKLLTT